MSKQACCFLFTLKPFQVYVLPSYTTKALCALDQTPHALMADRWASFKKAWSSQSKDLNLFQALAALRRITAEALSPKIGSAGWARCGFRAGELVQRGVVLSERFDEIFASKKAGAGDLGQPRSPTSAALDLLEAISPVKVKCTAEGCKASVAVTDRYCSKCGCKNAKFDADAAELYKQGRRPGWCKPPSMPEIIPETEAELKLVRN